MVIDNYIQSIIEDRMETSTDTIRRWYTCEKCRESFGLTHTQARPASIES